MMNNLSETTFKEEVLNDNGIVLVDFWAPWCGPCRMVGPILEEIARENTGRIKVAKVNIDEQPQLAQNYNVMSIPTMLIFKQGKLVEGFVGAMPKQAIYNKLERWLN